MKFTIVFFAIFCGVLQIGFSQNVAINVLTKDAGIVKKGNTIFFEVTINNTDQNGNIGTYKLKPQVTIADSSVVIENEGHQLPSGWKIISNNGKVITFSNAKDIIAATDARTILIALKGVHTGGPVIISGHMYFSNGQFPGNEPGVLKGDISDDNYSTSSCKVIN
jgi:hypothetical protein